MDLANSPNIVLVIIDFLQAYLGGMDVQTAILVVLGLVHFSFAVCLAKMAKEKLMSGFFWFLFGLCFSELAFIFFYRRCRDYYGHYYNEY